MKLIRIASFLFVMALSATTAWAQFGLYGAPEMLNLPQADFAITPYRAYANPVPNPVVPAVASAGPLVQAMAAGRYDAMPVEPVPPLRPPATIVRPAAADPPAADPNAYAHPLSPSCGAEPGCCGEAVYGGEAGCGDVCGGRSCCPWFGQVTALVMGRNHGDKLWTSYQANDVSHQLCNSQNIELSWKWGGEVSFGRRFCCDQWALEATYWTLDPFEGAVSCLNPNYVSTPLVVSGIEFAGVNGTNYFDGASEHRLWREDELHNVELNLIRYGMYSPCSPWAVDWSMGVRYFRFRECFVFGSRKGPSWGANGGLNEAYLNDCITNNLIGLQVGCDAGYSINYRWRLFASPKLGIYNNHMHNFFQPYRGDGTVAQPTALSGRPETFPVSSSKNVFSFLGELDIGAECQLTERWSARIGYRVVAVTDVGLADDQIPFYVVDIPEIASIDHNADLILHGAFVGLSYNY